MIPYGLIIKAVLGIVAVFILISVFKSAGTLVTNFFVEKENAVKREISDKQNLAYQTAKAEEMEKTLELTKAHHKEMQTIYAAQDVERKQSAAIYQKELDKDITGRIEELEGDFEDFERRATRATERVFREEERLSDWTTVNP
jgi:hypothetical protein